MKVSLNWVKQFTEVDVSTEELVALATERLGGIEGVVDYSRHYDGVVVAKIVSCIKHPNADKLSLCKVDDGGVVKDVERDEYGCVQVVCGAPNVREGLMVAWIPPGATVPASYGEKELFVLEARDLRGEVSNGMLASPAELGMSDDHSGILEIEEDVRLGTPFKNLYDLDDTIIEIENKMFTHRPDGFGHLGVAREIAGIQHKSFTSPEWYLAPEVLQNAKRKTQKEIENLAVTIDDAELCPRYMAVEFKDVTVQPSPLWLQSYLKRVGIRPINNIVDITNYIMMLTAQPVHAFDFDKIATRSSSSGLTRGPSEESNEIPNQVGNDGKRVEIIVRRPIKNEKMTLLDGKEITPHKDATLICNPNGPIALGGVMGGGNSEIDENTTHVVLECATFNMYNVRKTSMIHGLFTDAATRLTKGQPAKQLPSVLTKAIQMFEELAGAKTVGVVDQHPTKDKRQKTDEYIEIEAKFINDRLGSKFTSEEIVKLLTNVEFEAHIASGPIAVTPPFWRTDIEIKEDIVEEIGRLYGFNQLPITLPQRSITPVTPEAKRELKRRIRHTLSRAGANEVLTYSFVHGDLLKKVGQKTENSYALRNALSPELQYYRQSLTPSLLDLVHGNIKAGFDEFALFELNKAHNKIHGNGDDNLPGELAMVTLVFASKKQHTAYFHVRKYLDYLASSLGLKLHYSPITDAMDFPVTAAFDLKRSALVSTEDDVFLGIIGEYRSEVMKSLKLPQASAGFELGLEGLLTAMSSETNIYKPLSRYPSTEQDLTLKVASGVLFTELEKVLRSELVDSDYDWTLQPLSIYQRDEHGDDASVSHKNISFRITLTHHDRTLTTREVTELIEKLSWQAHEQLNAEQV